MGAKGLWVVFRLLAAYAALIVLSAATLGAVSPASSDVAYSIALVSLSGDGYQYTSAAGKLVRHGVITAVNSAGQAVGWSDLYRSDGQRVGSDGWLFDGTTTRRINLTGSGYEVFVDGGTHRQGSAQFFNSVGQAVGQSQRYGLVGTTMYILGDQPWLHSGGSTRAIGLTGSGYEYADPSGAGQMRMGSARELNGAGQVIGATKRVSSSGTALGYDAWLANASGSSRMLNLTGAGYEYAASGGTFRSGSAQILNEAGQVLGQSLRYSPTGEWTGSDVWFNSGTGASQRIGLAGSGYEYVQNGAVWRSGYAVDLNNAGQAIGHSARSTASGGGRGVDAWIYTSTSGHTLLGMTGAAYQYDANGTAVHYSASEQLNETGKVTGFSIRYTPTGQQVGRDAWYYGGSGASRVANLTGTAYEYASSGSTYREGVVHTLAESGRVVGTSQRFASNGATRGQDIWSYTGTGPTEVINLVGGQYERADPYGGDGIHRSGDIHSVNANGQVVGTSKRYGFGTSLLGTDAWFNSGSGPSTMISLSGAGYAASNGSRSASIVAMNNSGQVIGDNQRYGIDTGDQNGRAGWFYDNATGATHPLEFSSRSSDGWSYTDPTVLTESGVVLGSYLLFDQSTSLGNRGFWWRQDVGFRDLGALVEGGLAASGWEYLQSVYAAATPSEFGTGDSPWLIYGNGRMLNREGNAYDVFLMTATTVPEPTTLLVPLTSAGMLLRRRVRR
jgi:hypothetical protein